MVGSGGSSSVVVQVANLVVMVVVVDLVVVAAAAMAVAVARQRRGGGLVACATWLRPHGPSPVRRGHRRTTNRRLAKLVAACGLLVAVLWLPCGFRNP